MLKNGKMQIDIAELHKMSIFQLQLKIWDQIQEALGTIEVNGG